MLKKSTEKQIRTILPILMLELSEEDRKQSQVHFAFILFNNKIAYIAGNKPFRHPKQDFMPYHRQACIHAELHVILKSGLIDASNYEIVVVRHSRKTSNLANSRPCPACRFVIKQLGFKKVYWSTDDNNIISENLW